MPRKQEPETTRLESAEEILKAFEARKARKVAAKQKGPPPPPVQSATPHAGVSTPTHAYVVPEAKRERPTQRPPMALVCVLDDGLSEGEWVRLRGERTVFGRSAGDVVIPHDGQISGEHAEVVREWAHNSWRWVLRDLGSTNGTFVRVGSTVLKHDFEVLVGLGRYRFESAAASVASVTPAESSYSAGGTQMAQPFAAAAVRGLVPTLVEVTPAGSMQRYPLSQAEHWIGREPRDNAIVRADDPFLEGQHAKLYRDKGGQWHIANNGSANGIWLRVKHIALERSCQFRLGEQRFLFRGCSMRIRLKVISPAGTSRLFEHEGAAVSIGRDPSCDLLLENEEGTAASRQHARIELNASGATLIDLGSANKTQHNEQVVERPTVLRPGDRIQIGYTGAELVVLDLDLARPPPVMAKAGTGGRVLMVAAAGVAAFALVGALLLWQRGGDDKGEGKQVASANRPREKDDDKGKGVPPAIDPQPAPPHPVEPKEDRPREKKGPEKKEEPDPPVAPAPPADVRVVGNYLRPEKHASVLLQRYSEEKPWTALRSGQEVSTGQMLVSLPGYESVVALNTGVRLNLWGSLPQLGGGLVGESVVMLRVPEAGVDADIILDRGRVEMGNHKQKGPCLVRLRFLNEEWDVTLKDPNSRVVAELLYRLSPGTPEEVRLVGLFSKGDVAVKTRKKEFTFALPARLAWLSSRPDEIFEEKMKEPPPWWVNPPDLKDKNVQNTLLFLGDWAEGRFLADKAEPDVVYAMQTSARDPSKDPKDRELGLWFLAGIDEAAKLVEFLRDPDPNTAAIRNTAMLCLQDWIRRNAQLRGVLARQLNQRHSFPPGVAASLVRLLSPLSEEDRGKPEPYQELIDLLDHEDVGLRHLGFWHLYEGLKERMPDAAYKITYDPMEGKKERQAAVAKWKKLIPAGSVPPRRPDKGKS